MKFKLTPDLNFLELVSCTQLEYDQLVSSFNKTQENWFIIRKKFPHWDGKISFFSTQSQRVPRGLWFELKKLSKKFEFPVEIEGAQSLINADYNEDDFDNWINEYFTNPDIKPRYYQIDGAKAILKYMKCTEEISTSGGKTLISYMLFKYLFDRGKIKKMLYVVPNIGLIEQSEDKFYQYEEKCGITDPLWKSMCVFSGAKRHKDENANIVFGTYQSLTKKDLEYFKDFDVLFVDECLHPDTLITMSDFSKKKIKDINVGDSVWTYNEEKNIYEIKDVEFVYKNLSKADKVYEIKQKYGYTLKITGNHKVLLQNNVWKRVDELTEKDIIININFNSSYNLIIKSIKEINYSGGVYNLRIKTDSETNHNYFANDLCVSNCHHAQNQSLKTISTKCYNAKYKFGMTGTLPKEDSCNSFTIQSYLGPNVYTLPSHQLINEGNATPVNIIGIQMDYLNDSIKKELYDLRNVSADEKDGAKLLNLEKQIARDERKRLLYICDIIAKSKKNSIVLFSDIKNSYGKDIYNWLRENTTKTIYYIDGQTDTDNREYYKQKMESDEDVIIVASVGTMGEGIDIQNVSTIYIVESTKSPIIVPQILGRGMRLSPGKEKIIVFDFSDDFKYNGTNKYQQKNYLLRHAEEREKIYRERKFPFKKFKVKL